jgi:tRNA(Ile)-lysidine synthase TilS/MesJ
MGIQNSQLRVVFIDHSFFQYAEMKQDHHKVENVYKKLEAISHKTVAQLDRDQAAEDEAQDTQYVPTGMIFVENPLRSLLKPETVVLFDLRALHWRT